MPVIKIGQLNPDGDALNEIGAWVITEATWNQLQRTFPVSVPSDTPYSVWIDYCDDDGDMIADEPMVIEHYHGQWLLRDWLKPQPREWKLIQSPPESGEGGE